ncbi:sugar transferase, partial [Acinetobacter baumannii]|nr:sugar transferase [Acinetobacter baumannii]
KTSLDELPQLWNVLRGEMSLVGPRPIVQAEVARYGRAFATCFAVPPGVTGLWQVSGRSDTSYAERVALDLDYASRWSLRRDIAIMLRTVPAVLAQRGSK